MARALALCVLALGAHASRAAEPAPRRLVIGDAGNELRTPEGRVDVQRTIERLAELGANTYLYQVWHGKHDWDDFPAFADAAAERHIDVWVYLVPWSETTLKKKTWNYSEPFKTDYVAWAEAIGKASLEHPNLVGWTIDDFYDNTTQADRFTPAYVKRMTDAARAHNPKLKFYPVVYFQQPWADFVERFGPLVDGVIACYPRSEEEVDNALTYLNDEPHGPSLVVRIPRHAKLPAGASAVAAATFTVTDASRAKLQFFWDDQNNSAERGLHEAFVRVDGEVVWRQDVANEAVDRWVNVNLAGRIAGRNRHVQVEVGVVSTEETSTDVVIRFDDIRARGMRLTDAWAARASAGLGESTLTPPSPGGGRFHLPQILMPAGWPDEYEKRYGEPAAPANIANRVKFCVEMAQKDKAQGVVTWYTPKDPGNPVFDAVAGVLKGARTPKGQD
jgi:hypothetical protein